MRPVGMRRPRSVPPRCSVQLPAEGWLRPATMRSKVLLPQPEGPSRLRNSPRETVRSTPSSACNPDAKRFSTPRTVRIGSGAISELPDNPDKPQREQHKAEQFGGGQAFAKEAPRDEIA